MKVGSETGVRVLIEARDLDTDERSEVVLSAARPGSEEAREGELRSLIASVHPEAKFRSFAGDVATALGSQHLIVAHYIGEAAPARPAAERQPASPDGDQGELFAA